MSSRSHSSASSDGDGRFDTMGDGGGGDFSNHHTTHFYGEAVDHEVKDVPVEEFMQMGQHQQHVLVQERFDAIKHNRRLREDGRDADGYVLRQYTSNFKQLMRTLEVEDAKASGNKKGAKAYNKGGDYFKKVKHQQQVQQQRNNGGDGALDPTGGGPAHSPLMSEIRRMEEEEAAKKKQKLRNAIQMAQRHQLGGGGGDDDDGMGDGDGGGGGGGIHTMLDYIDEDDIERAVNMPPDIKSQNQSAIATAHRHREMGELEERNENLKALGRMLETHMLLVRPRLKRSKSSPGAYHSMASFEYVSRKAKDQAQRIAELEQQLRGAAPRPMERQLEKQISSLEDQISNQIALIRGLREKLRIVREQHKHCLMHQRPINSAIGNAYHNGFNAGQQHQQQIVGAVVAGGKLLPPLLQPAVGGGGGSEADVRATAGDGPSKSLALRPTRSNLSGAATRTSSKQNLSQGGGGTAASATAASNSSAATAVVVGAPTVPAADKAARVFPEVRNQFVDDSGAQLPQGKNAAAVVISVHSLPHLLSTMPEVVYTELLVLREVIKPSSTASHLYPQHSNGAASKGGMRSQGDGAMGLSLRNANANGRDSQRGGALGAGRSNRAQRGLAGGQVNEMHPFYTCRGVEAARFICEGTEQYMFVFPSATDAVKYCLLTQQRLLDATWGPSLGDEYETGVEMLQGASNEYVWRGLRVSMGIEMGATIRPDPLLADVSVPPQLFGISQGGSSANGSGATTPQMAPFGLSPTSFSLTPAASSPASMGMQLERRGSGVFGPAADDANDAMNTSDQSADEEEAHGIAMAEGMFAANCPVVAIPYEGHAVDTAAYLAHIAVGGEILLTKSVVDGIDMDATVAALQSYFQYKYLVALGAVECPFADLTPQLKYWGDLGHHFSKSSVFRVVGPTLVSREGVFRRDIHNAERAYATQQATVARGPFDDVAPPSVTLTGRPIAVLGLVLTDWAVVLRLCSPAVAAAAKAMIFGAVREVSIACRGYVSRVLNRCEGYILCFDEVVNAASFGLKIHDHLMALDWPEQLIKLPQFGRVEIDKKVLFNGPRVQCGMLLCTPGKRTTGTTVVCTYRDPLTQRTLFSGGGTELVSVYTQQAAGGELLAPADTLPIITKHHEFLGFAVQTHCLDVSTPTSDTLIGLYQVFTRRRALCASYVNRETRLRSEADAAAVDNKIVKLYEDQIATLKEKLFHKDQSIKRLDTIIGEKNNVIAEIRSEVMKHAHYKYNWSDTLGKLSIGSTKLTLDSVLVGVSFSHAEAIYRQFPSEASTAVKLYGQLVDKLAGDHHAKLVTRLPSGIARIYQFSEAGKAIDFWMKLNDRALGLEWPPQLEDCEHTTTIRAAEIVENLHPNLDQLVWKGLRPTAVMDYGLPHYQFDSISRTFSPYGPEIDFIGQMLKVAGDGDCIVSLGCSIFLQKNMGHRTATVRLAAYGPDGCERLTSSEQRMRLKALRTVFPSDVKIPHPQPRTMHKALAVFVAVPNVAALVEEDKFTADLLTFQRCVERLILEYKGILIGTDGKGHRYSILFTDVDDGIDFISTIHSVLMHCTWSSALLREEEFADRIYEGRQIMGGVAARVGAHIVHNVAVTVQPFGGVSLYRHKELSFPCVLSHHAHAGETLATEEVFTELMQSTRERSAKIYPDLIGALTGIEEVRSHPIHVYQLLPMELHFRSAVFLEEDRVAADPLEQQRRRNMSKKVTSKRKQYFDAFTKDEAMLQTCERTLNPVDDPVRLNQRLYSHIKAAMDNDRQRFVTSQRTLQMLESISMLTEDRASLPVTARGYPFHVHLVLYMMENNASCQDYLFDKKYAVDLLRADWGDDDGEDGDGVEGRSIGTLMNHVGGASRARAASKAARGSGPNAGGRFGSRSGAGDGGDDGGDPSHETFRSRMQHIQGQKVLPEDLVRLHVDVERFANIVELNGLTKEAGRQWVSCFPELCSVGIGTAPRDEAESSSNPRRASEARRGSSIDRTSTPSAAHGLGAQSTNAKQLRALSSLRSTIGLTIDDVDTEMIRNSIVANLSHILHKILYAADELPGGMVYAGRRGSVLN